MRKDHPHAICSIRLGSTRRTTTLPRHVQGSCLREGVSREADRQPRTASLRLRRATEPQLETTSAEVTSTMTRLNVRSLAASYGPSCQHPRSQRKRRLQTASAA
jgi:hypothetical protein